MKATEKKGVVVVLEGAAKSGKTTVISMLGKPIYSGSLVPSGRATPGSWKFTNVGELLSRLYGTGPSKRCVVVDDLEEMVQRPEDMVAVLSCFRYLMEQGVSVVMTSKPGGSEDLLALLPASQPAVVKMQPLSHVDVLFQIRGLIYHALMK